MSLITTLRKTYQLLSARQKRELIGLQIVIIIAAVIEVAGVGSIAPFMAIASNPDIIHTHSTIEAVYKFVGAPTESTFVLYVGLCFLAIIVVTNLTLLMTNFFLSRFSQRLGAELSGRLYHYYLTQNMEFHKRENSATLLNKTILESEQISLSIVLPALRMNSRLMSLLLLTIFIVILNPTIAISAAVLLGGSYLLIYRSIRHRVQKNGARITRLNRERTKLISESLLGIRDIKLYQSERRFSDKYLGATKTSKRAAANNMIFGQAPHYIMEMISIGGIVALTLYFLSVYSDINQAIPTLSLFVMAGYKLIPMFQQIYRTLTRIKGATASFEVTEPDLKKAIQQLSSAKVASGSIHPRESINLEDITYTHPGGTSPTLTNLNLKIPARSIIAITGDSGEGKSTLLDILAGLIQPDKGEIAVDGKALSTTTMADWRNSIGYVSQDSFLLDSTVAENIAFSVDLKDIDMERAKLAAQQALISKAVNELPKKYLTVLGEQGSILSGGQQQRIAIARALYRDISVLILDEATSSLDHATQRSIMENIRSLKENISVIYVTHRKETLEFADAIYTIAEGRLFQASNLNRE